MSEHIFDTLTRSTAAATSRRGYARALVGLALAGVWSSSLSLDDVEAKKKGRKRKKKRNRNKKSNQGNKSPLSCTPSCADKVCGDDGCGGSCGTCASGELCAQGKCVIGQGTCDTGQDICVNAEDTCAISDDCMCWTSTSNQTRCGELHALSNETGLCTTDDDCAELFSNVPGAFCVSSTGDRCPGEGGFCYAPCSPS